MTTPHLCRKCKKEKRPRSPDYRDATGYCECGRPSMIDNTALAKLHDAFVNAFTDEMACLYAGITEDALRRYCEKYPEYRHQKETLKKTPNLKAQQVLVNDVSNVSGARYWAERRMPEFMPKSKVDVTVTEPELEVERTPEEIAAMAALRDARRKRIEANSDKMP